jgi:hypothetical protein
MSVPLFKEGDYVVTSTCIGLTTWHVSRVSGALRRGQFWYTLHSALGGSGTFGTDEIIELKTRLATNEEIERYTMTKLMQSEDKN